MKSLSRRIVGHAWLWLPALLALLLILPRILSAQFGLMDDGVIAMNAENYKGVLFLTDFDLAGRFRPVYWQYYSGLYRLIGANPWIFYLLHAAMFTAIVALVILLVRRLGGNRMQAFIAGIVALSAGPVIENFYTLSKGEPLQTFLVLAGLLVIQSLAGSKTKWGRVLIFCASALMFVLASLVKETFVVMPAVGLAWVGLGWLLKRWPSAQVDMRLRAMLAAALFVAAVIFLAAALPTMTIRQSGNYATRYDLNIARLFESLIGWRAWFTRDFLFCLPLAALFAVQLFFRKPGPAPIAALDALVFLAAWLIVFLPWEFTVEYYLLMAAMGAAVFSGVVGGGWISQFPLLRPGWKAGTALLAAAACYLWLATLPNLWNNARLQLTIDRVNQQMVEFLAENVPANGTVMVNLSPGAEYLEELDYHLAYFYNRADIQVKIFQFQTPQNSADSVDYWLVTPAVVNKPIYSVRFGFLETAQQRANNLLMDFAPQAEASFTGGYHQWIVRPLQPVCWILRSAGACQEGSRWISRLPLEYRWDIYHWRGNWAGQSRTGIVTLGGLWRLSQEDGTLREVQFGSGSEFPLAGDVNGDGQTDLVLFDPAEGTWQFDTDLDGAADLSLVFPENGSSSWPLLGDWDGDGRDSPAVFEQMSKVWWFYDEGGHLLQTLTAGLAGDIPLAGDWNGDGRDTIGVYRPDSGEVDLENELTGPLSGVDFYAPTNSQPVAGHWAGLPLETLAFFSDGAWQPYYWNRDGEPVLQPEGFSLGATGDRPLAGRW